MEAEQERHSVITDEMRAAIGVETEPWTVEVDKTSARMFARALGYEDQVYYDEELARSMGFRSLPCPPHFLGTDIFNPAVSDAVRGARRRAGNGRFANPYKRGLAGGTDIEYFNEGPSDAICAGDVLEVTGRISDIRERTGSLGPMLIVEGETIYRRNGEIVAIWRRDSISY